MTESGPATSNATTSYTYDDAGKVTQESGPYGTIAYGYETVGTRADFVGNRLSKTVTGAVSGSGLVNGTTSYFYDANDRITSQTGVGAVTHTYDNNGNETTVNGQAASYDFENHLTGLGNAATSYVYDADGNRVSVTTGSTTTSYLVDTSPPYASVVEEYSGSSTTAAARYDYGDDLLRMDRGGIYYYLYDGLGSTRQLANSAGAVTDTWGFDAFGEQVSHTGGTLNPFLFNAQQFDAASGDYFLRARYYDQSNGRFISQDPFGGSDEDPITLHRYLYTSDDPTDMVDPGGQDGELAGLASSIAVSAIIGGVSNAAISGVREAIFNPQATTGTIVDAVSNGFDQGAAVGALAAIPILGPGVLIFGTAQAGYGGPICQDSRSASFKVDYVSLLSLFFSASRSGLA